MDLRLLNCGDSDFGKIMEIRQEVFVNEQGVEPALEFDSYDENFDTVYCLLTDDIPCATGRLIKTEGGYKIGRIATLKEKRKKGCGAAVVNALCEKAFSCGAECVILEAQLHAIPFYEKLGFKVASDEVIIDAGIEHKLMRKHNG